MNRIDAHGLKIAARPVRFYRQGSHPQYRDFAGCVLGRACRDRPRSGSEEPRAARGARRAAGQDRRLASRPQGQAVRHQCLYGVPQGDRLSAAGARDPAGRDRQCRRRDRKNLRAAAGGAAHQRALCAERRQRALGQSLRRVLRHRRDPARPQRNRQGFQQGARRQGGGESQGVSRPRRAAGDRKPYRRDLLQRDRGPARGETQERQRHRAEIERAIRRLSGRCGGALRGAAGQQRHAYRTQDRSRPYRSARTIRPASPT